MDPVDVHLVWWQIPLLAVVILVLPWVIAWIFIRSAVRSGTLQALRQHHRETANERRQARQSSATQYRPPTTDSQFDIVNDGDGN